MTTKTIQVINFNLDGITHDDFLNVANEVAPHFAELPDLALKVWLSNETNNTYGGVYSWEGQDALDAYRSGELYAGALANNTNFSGLKDQGFDVLEGPTAVTSNLNEATPTYVQVINFNLDGINLDEFMGVANGVASDFAALPGLIAKSWLSDKTNNTYGGVYLWETQESCEAYRNGDLYAGALTNNPAFSNLTDRGFDILEGPSRVTYMK